MTDIDSNRDTNATRVDQDNEKNTTSPIGGGNNAGASDIDERNRAGAPRRGDDVAQTQTDDQGVDREQSEGNTVEDSIAERGKPNP